MKKLLKNKNRGSSSPKMSQGGQFLIEMMVAVTLIVVGMLGVFAVLSQSLALNRVAANQYIAAHLAAEGIEVTKNLIDKNYINGNTWNLGITGGYYRVQFNSGTEDGSQKGLIAVPEDRERQPPLEFDEEGKRYGYSIDGEETPFKREIRIIEENGGNTIRAISTVYWKDRGGVDFETVIEDQFRNWRTQ